MFEPEKLHFNFVDLLGAPRRALKAKKIWVHLLGLAVGYPIYVALTYAALVLDGTSFVAVWERFGAYPFFQLDSGWISGALAWTVYALGVLFWLLVTLLAATVVARITYKELKGDPFYASKEGFAFLRGHWQAVIYSPVALAIIIAFFLIVAGIMALVGRIPYLGEVVFLGFYPLYFLGAGFVLYTLVVLGVLLLYVPAIVALWEEDAMGTTFQAYSITWNQAWRTLVYSGLLGGLTLGGVTLYGWAVTGTYHFLNWVFGMPWLMGGKLGPLVARAEQLVFSGYSSFFTYIPGLWAGSSPLAAGIDLAGLSGWEWAMGSLLALLLFLIYGSVLAYGLSIITVGQSLSYLIYKFRTDDDNLLEREDEEELAAEAEEGDQPTQPGADEEPAAEPEEDEQETDS